MQIQIHYLFSKSKKIGSKIIRSGTSFLQPQILNTPSHVAVLINEKWVVESTLESGFRVISYKDWLNINIEVCKIACVRQRTMQEIKDLFRPLKNCKYDWMGVFYFSFRVALKRVFRIGIPQKNVFQHKDKYFCCEVVSKMTGVSYEMTAPNQLLHKILESIGEFSQG